MVGLQDGHLSILPPFFFSFSLALTLYLVPTFLLSGGLVVVERGRRVGLLQGYNVLCVVGAFHFVVGYQNLLFVCCVFWFCMCFRGDSLVLQELGFTGCR